MIHPSQEAAKVTEGLMQVCDDMSVTYRNSMDAAMEASSVLAKGYEELSRKVGSLMQETMSCAMQAGKSMMTARNMKELSDMQSEFVRTSFDKWVSATGKISEISSRTTQEALEPVARQASDSINQVAQKAQTNGQAA